MKKNLTIALLLIAFTFSLHADILELKNGKLLTGTYQGGTTGTIRFETSGKIEVYPVSSIIALTISRSANAQAQTVTSTPPAQPAPTVQPAPTTVQQQPTAIPAGTIINVTLRSTLSTASARPGQKFEAALADNLKVGSVIIAPLGSLVRGSITGVSPPRRIRKSAMLAFTLDEIVVSGKSIRIATNTNKTETGPDGSIVKGAIMGAVIGEIADGDASKGAEIGAAAGAMKKGDHIVFQAGTNVSFKLSANVALSP